MAQPLLLIVAAPLAKDKPVLGGVPQSLLHITLLAAASLVQDKFILNSIPQDLHDGLMRYMTKDQQILLFSQALTWYPETDVINTKEIYVNSKKTSHTVYNVFGGIQERLLIVNDKGLSERFSEDGSLIHSAEYMNGKRHGLSQSFSGGSFTYSAEFVNGSLKHSAEYVNGKRHGLFQSFSGGSFTYSAEFVNGKKHGPLQFFFLETGSLRSSQEFVNGKKHGPLKQFSKTGLLISSKEYVNGVLVQ